LDDSGWQIFSGGESGQFMQDAANFRIVEVGQVIDRYPMFKEVMDARAGSLFNLQDDRYVAD